MAFEYQKNHFVQRKMHYISKIIAKGLDMKNIKVYFYGRYLVSSGVCSPNEGKKTSKNRSKIEIMILT